MQNRLIIIVTTLCLCLNIQAQTKHIEDSLKAIAINKEAEDSNFIHAYLFISTAGKTIHTAFGHAAIRMVCKSKDLDFCFSFDNDRDRSSLITQFNRKSKAGFNIIPTPTYINNYKLEGRGITSFELNLSPKEKQKLWKFLDKQKQEGLIWTFDYTTINCLSMAIYAINSAIAPSQIHFKKMPYVVYQDLDTWMDYITIKSPWSRIIVHAGLRNVKEKDTKPEDLLIPTMMDRILPYAVISNFYENSKPLIKDSGKIILKAKYRDEPCWFTPTMALVIILTIIIILTLIYIYKNKIKH